MCGENQEMDISGVSLDTLDGMIDSLKKTSEEMTEFVLEGFKKFTLEHVQKMRIAQEPAYDFNSYPFMSRIILEQLLKYAEDRPSGEVKMFIGDVRSEFYGEELLFDRVRELAAKNISFNIILSKQPENEYLPRWRELIAKSPGSVSVRIRPEYEDRLSHLVLIGDSYRLEVPHTDYTGEVTELLPLRPARFGFHDEAYVREEVTKHWDKANTDDAVLLEAAIA
ncbi:MAG: hypothetical protein K8R02_00840 [Anaerohalosphaeraceae bacterium]|nr:hypothetical protein [Anaerohalosphaeraceae bacterium]